MTWIATMSRAVAALLAAVVASASASADPYWVAYEGDDYPENQGWERVYGDENGPQQGGSNRSLDDGLLVLDSTRNHLIYDTYFWRQEINPDPGEMFICEWRMRVISNAGPAADSGLGIARDGGGYLGFDLGYDYVQSSREDWHLSFTPNEFHTYRIESIDMVRYSLWLDGAYAIDGTWVSSLNESYIGFGDARTGSTITSFAEWDYVRFGVVPEPVPLISIGIAMAWGFSRRK